MSIELYLSLNENGELVLEGDLGPLGDGRELLVEDTGGPTTWDWDPAIELPERTFDLTFKAIVNEFAESNFDRAWAINVLVSHQRIVDER